MLKCGRWPVGVCSWSLQMDIPSVAAAMKKLRINHIHLAVGPAAEKGGEKYLAQVREQGWTISSTMIGFPQEDYSSLDSIRITGGIAPDNCWQQNSRLYEKAVEATAALGVKYLSTHAGFIDHSRAEYAKKFHERILFMADSAAEKGIMLLLETGQETAGELRSFLEELDHSAVGVNFDPANMILYGKGEPVEAVRTLGKWIRHVHIKDAVATAKPGIWGTEAVWGTGQAGGEEFLSALADTGFDGTIAIEREGGDNRFEDIKAAAERLSRFGG